MTDKRAKTELLEVYAKVLGREDDIHRFLERHHQGIEKCFKQHELKEFIERIELSYGVILEDDYFIVSVDSDALNEFGIGATIGYSDIWEIEKQQHNFEYYVKESYEKYC